MDHKRFAQVSTRALEQRRRARPGGGNGAGRKKSGNAKTFFKQVRFHPVDGVALVKYLKSNGESFAPWLERLALQTAGIVPHAPA